MNAFGLTFHTLENNLFVDQHKRRFTYSDGCIAEGKILEVMTSASDVSSLSWELHRSARTWPETYHLSIYRGAIVRCLPFRHPKRVLELGAGCGAVTRALAEKFVSVDAIEGSIDRARICAMRCRDLQNVRIFAADLDNVTPEPQYDVVFLVGVLEWSEGFLPAPDPFHRCLEIASKSLREDGLMVVAIENQLGLKYFLGAGEDHCGAPMEGLHGYPTLAKARTFSRSGLSGLLQNGGFPVFRFFYPFPDYKFARVVLTDEAVALNSESIAYWVSRHNFGDYNQPANLIYGNQSLITSEIAKAGLLAELSNSFLVVAAKTASAIDCPPWLVWSERLARNLTVNCVTTLQRVDDQLLVDKAYASFQSRRLPDTKLGFAINKLSPQTFFTGSSIEIEMLRCAIAGNATGFIDLIAKWLDYVRMNLSSSDMTRIRPDGWDCIPRNLVRLSSGRLVAIDLEFVNENRFDLETLCGRGLYCWFLEHGQWANNLNAEVRTVRQALLWILAKLFAAGDPERLLAAVIEAEANFQCWVNPGEIHDAATFLDAPMERVDVQGFIAQRLKEKQDELGRLKEHADRLQTFSDAVRQTLAYRFYKNFLRPFRRRETAGNL